MNNIPTIGMCGKVPEGMRGDFLQIMATPYDGIQKCSGNLSLYSQPEIPVRLINGNKKTEWINALIDTGAAFSLAKQDILESIGVRVMGHKEADHIEERNVMLETYACGFQFAGMPVGISAVFMKLRDSFRYDIVIGANIFQFCDLYIYGKEKRFELIFY
ncbi:MAG: hypothetical protein FWD60_13230 [Candidatus Azobacteroides sp.]|nr:hypothetical protein [Candidatus Azobacteroides sp.]